MCIRDSRGVPTLIQEQNSYAGVTNKLLASKAHTICVAYEGMERFFPAGKIVLTGNPVRQDLCNDRLTRDEAFDFFGLDPSLFTDKKNPTCATFYPQTGAIRQLGK